MHTLPSHPQAGPEQRAQSFAGCLGAAMACVETQTQGRTGENGTWPRWTLGTAQAAKFWPLELGVRILSVLLPIGLVLSRPLSFSEAQCFHL